MADFEIKQKPDLPRLSKTVGLSAGQKLSDDAEVLAFAQKTVPADKNAIIQVEIKVIKLRDN